MSHENDGRTAPGWVLPLLGALAMSVGWGYRGDYGHEAGAMMPGALLGLAIALAANRPDWVERASLLGFLGAIGWAFGGSISYGKVVGYTASGSLADVLYGYSSLLLIGALWGGVGAAILALGVTKPRSELEGFAMPLLLLYFTWWLLYFSGLLGRWQERYSFHDTDWVPATAAVAVAAIVALLVPGSRRACGLIALLGAGWWAGFAALTLGLDLHMTPPRSDNWSGSLGLAVALFAYLAWTRDRAALWAGGVGLVAGGLGFVLGDFANMLGRADWGPIGRDATLTDLNSWKWMEQGFGLIMGLGVALAFTWLARAPIAEAVDDAPERSPLRLLAPAFLLVPMLWESLWKNVRGWVGSGVLREGMFRLEACWWCLIVGLAVSIAVLWAVWRAHQGRLALAPGSRFGRAQLLFLLLLWVPALAALLQVMPGLDTRGALFVHVSFWLTAAACSLIVVSLDPPQRVDAGAPGLEPDDPGWRPGRVGLAVGIGAPILAVLLVAFLTVAAHEGPLNGAQVRFGSAAAPSGPAE